MRKIDRKKTVDTLVEEIKGNMSRERANSINSPFQNSDLSDSYPTHQDYANDSPLPLTSNYKVPKRPSTSLISSPIEQEMMRADSKPLTVSHADHSKVNKERLEKLHTKSILKSKSSFTASNDLDSSVSEKSRVSKKVKFQDH